MSCCWSQPGCCEGLQATLDSIIQKVLHLHLNLLEFLHLLLGIIGCTWLPTFLLRYVCNATHVSLQIT